MKGNKDGPIPSSPKPKRKTPKYPLLTDPPTSVGEPQKIGYKRIGTMPEEMNRENLFKYLRHYYPDEPWSANMRFEVILHVDDYYYIRETSTPKVCAIFSRAAFLGFVQNSKHHR